MVFLDKHPIGYTIVVGNYVLEQVFGCSISYNYDSDIGTKFKNSKGWVPLRTS